MRPLSIFMSFPQLPPSISVTFPLSPTAPIHLCPCLPSLQSFLLYHCRAPHCFSPSRVPFLSCLPKLLCMIMPSIFLLSAVHPPTLSKHAHKIFNPVIISRPFSYFVSTPISSLLQRLPTVYFPRWACCWWKPSLDANELLILSAASLHPPHWVSSPPALPWPVFWWSTFGWWTPICVTTLTSLTADTCNLSVSLSILPRPLSPVINEQTHSLNPLCKRKCVVFILMLRSLTCQEDYFWMSASELRCVRLYFPILTYRELPTIALYTKSYNLCCHVPKVFCNFSELFIWSSDAYMQ